MNENRILDYRNFVPLNLRPHMHYNSKAESVYKVLLGSASVKKKKKINWNLGHLGLKQYICPDVKS